MCGRTYGEQISAVAIVEQKSATRVGNNIACCCRLEKIAEGRVAGSDLEGFAIGGEKTQSVASKGISYREIAYKVLT